MNSQAIVQNSLIIALAKKLVELRFVAFPKNSYREHLFYRYVRPVIAKRLASSNSTLISPTIVTTRPEQFERNAIKEILVIKCDQIGDFVLSLPAFSILRKGFPNSRISLLCSSANAKLATQSGLFEEVISLDFFNLIEDGNALQKIENRMVTLKNNKYDLAFDLRVEPETRFLLNYINAGFKAGFEHLFGFLQAHQFQLPPLDFAFPIPSVEVQGAKNHARHTQHLLSSFVSSLVSFFNSNTDRNVSVHPLSLQEPSILVSRQGKGPIIAFNIGSGAQTRNWPSEHFSVLAKLLVEKLDATIVLMGIEAQQQEADFIGTAANIKNFVNLTGKIPLGELPSLIQRLDIYVGHDTGGTHLSSSLDQLTICLHSGVTPLETYGPLGERTVIIKCIDLPCSPCGLQLLAHCKNGHICMTAIAPMTVFDEIEKLLNANQGKIIELTENYASVG